ncbi:MAG: DUF1444 family protein [Planctomyces sp.]|nr:DUF1444 family protein [Planctomyces sp.]
MPANHPDHWELLQGTANWYQLWHPPQWAVSERSGATTLQLPGDGFLALHCSLDAKNGGTPPDLMQVVRLFPRARRIVRLNRERLEFLHEAMEGEADLKTAPRWWMRPFVRSDWRKWSIWAFHRGDLLIVATLVHGREFDQEVASLVRMALGTLEIAETPADPPDVFAKRVLDLARRKFPLIPSARTDDFQIRIGESAVNLFNMYRTYIRSPERFEEILLPALTTVVQVQEWGERQTEPPLDAVRERIMPMLYPESVWKSRFPNFIGTPWIAGLVILYVIDESQAYWYIREGLLDSWRISADDIHGIAMDNLQQYFEKQPMEMAVAGSEMDGPTMLMPGRADSYNSSRLLSETFVTRLREVVGGNFAVGLPGRDFFVVVSLKSQRMVDHVRRKVREDYAQMDHPLTDRMLLVSADGVSELPIEGADDGPFHDE